MLELVVGNLLGGSDCTGSGVVDENIHASELLHGGCNRRLHLLGIGDVAAERQHLYAEFLIDSLCILLKEVHAAGKKHEVGTLAGERLCHLESKPGGSTGYNGHAAGEIKIVFHFRKNL